jgi:hypothetical protein
VKPVVGPGMWVRVDFSVLWVSFGAAVGAGAGVGVNETLFGLQAAFGARLAAGPVRFAVGLVGRPVLLLKNGADAAFETGLLGNIEVGAVGPLFIGFAGESLVRLAPVAPALGSPFGFRASLLLGVRL